MGKNINNNNNNNNNNNKNNLNVFIKRNNNKYSTNFNNFYYIFTPVLIFIITTYLHQYKFYSKENFVYLIS